MSKLTSSGLLKNLFTGCRTVILGLGLFTGLSTAHATTVQIQTVMGDFEVNLFDKHTPKTVENFLAYVNANAYTDSIMHRSVPGFVVQGGGFKYDGQLPPVEIPRNPAVVNEPLFSNVRGTIAMAKIGNDPNSATNQWFINLADNSQNLDRQNGGFTVFGQVVGNGMAIVDAMAALNRFNLGGAFTEMPLRNFSTDDVVDEDHLVLVTGIVVLDPSPNTADGLNPVRRSVGSSSSSASSTSSSGGGSGGGSMGPGSLLLMFGLLVSLLTNARRKRV